MGVEAVAKALIRPVSMDSIGGGGVAFKAAAVFATSSSGKTVCRAAMTYPQKRSRSLSSASNDNHAPADWLW